MTTMDNRPCFLYKKGEWITGEWYHREALYQYIAQHAMCPSLIIKRITINRPDDAPFDAYFSSEEDQIFFMETTAESTDDIFFITMVLPVI